MKIKYLLALILILSITGNSGCQVAQPTELPPATSIATAANVPPSPLPPTAGDTMPAPTVVPPTLENTQPPATPIPPTSTVLAIQASSTPIPATGAPGEPTATSAGAISSDLIPVEGIWTGSGDDLILSFNITHENAQAMLGDLAVLWLGPDECSIDLVVPDKTELQVKNFTRYFKSDDMHYDLVGNIISPILMTGKIVVHYEGCSERTIQWVASPKK